MKLMRLAACAVAFAVVGGMAVAEDMDIKALQAKLAAQEARLNDLQAKMGSGKADAPANIISMRKNAKVTIGGAVDTRYYFRDAEFDAGIDGHAANGAADVDYKTGSLEVATGKLAVQVDVNENIDAFLQLDLYDATGRADNSGIAQAYWVRWKNICNSGWGFLVGRDALKFGMAAPIGVRDQWNHEISGEVNITTANIGTGGDGMFIGGSVLPDVVGVGQTRVTQLNPYWESCDGKFKAEFSLFQGVELRRVNSTIGNTEADVNNNLRGLNYGVGSGALRLTWTPTEDWTFVAGAINMHADKAGNYSNKAGTARADANGAAAGLGQGYNYQFNKNAYAYHLAAKWNPAAFCKKLTVWANMTHEFNNGWVDDMDTLVVTAGFMYDLTDKLTAFAMGDYMTTNNDRSEQWNKAAGWRSYVGAKYNIGNGLNFEAGWIHDDIDYKDEAGHKHANYSGDVLYAHLGFSF